jgi:hypothetical protein
MAAALRALAIKPFEPLRFSAAVQASLLNRLRCSRLNACAVRHRGKEMTEGNVRKVHATVGVILSIFLLVQIGSGTIVAFNEFLGHGHHVHAGTTGHDVEDPNHDTSELSSTDNVLQIIHHHGGRLVQALRTTLGLGALFMVLSGARIYALARKRKGRMSNEQG